MNLRYSLYGGRLLLRRACVWCVEEGQKKLSCSKIASKRIAPRSWHLRNLIILCYEKMMCNVFKFMLITTLHSVSLLLLSSYKKGNALSYPLNSLPSLASLSLSCFPPLLHFMLCHVRTQGNALSPRSTGLDSSVSVAPICIYSIGIGISLIVPPQVAIDLLVSPVSYLIVMILLLLLCCCCCCCNGGY